MKADYMCHNGDDLTVVNAARVSFSKESKELNDKDVKLLNFLAREKHVLPFRHPHLTLRCKAPIFVARQLMKHQVGLSWSEESRRYIDDPPEFYWPDKWRRRADNVKQGSSEEEFDPLDWKDATWEPTWQQELRMDIGILERWYLNMISEGCAPEQARMILPQNMYTNWVWTGSLLAWVQMLKLRLDSHAQRETQDFAKLVVPHLEKLYPVSFKALMDH